MSFPMDLWNRACPRWYCFLGTAVVLASLLPQVACGQTSQTSSPETQLAVPGKQLSPPLELPGAPSEDSMWLGSLSPKLDQQQWMREAKRMAREYASRPDIELTACRSSQDQIAFRFRVNTRLEEAQKTLALAIPAGEITTATLEATRLSPRPSDAPAASTSKFKVQELGYVRNHHIAQVTIPLDSPTTLGQKVSEGIVRIWFAAQEPPSQAKTAWAEAESTGVLRALVEKLVANPKDIDRFALPSPESVPSELADSPEWHPGICPSPFWLRVPVEQTKAYRVTGADLESSGVVLADLRPEHLRLALEGKDQPLYYVPDPQNKSGRVAKGDAFIFYGCENASPYSRTNCYWLYSDASRPASSAPAASPAQPGKPAENALVFTDKLLVEHDNEVLIRNDQFLSILGHRWVWQELTTSQPISFQFDAPGLANMPAELPASLLLYAHSWPNNGKVKLHLQINSAAPQEFQMTSGDDDKKSFKIPSGVLRARGNTALLSLEDLSSTRTLQGEGPMELYLDRLEVDYPRTYSTSNATLEFSSPSRPGSTTASEKATSAAKDVEYRIAGITNPAQCVILDVTDTTPLAVKYDVAASASARQPSVAHFRVHEQGTRRYLLTSPKAAAPATLEPLAKRADLRSQKNRADYVIISHGDFMKTIAPFGEVKHAAGHEVALVDIRDVYDQFACGQETPEAIKRFLRYAASHWHGSAQNPAASFVLLVGDATSAYRNEFHNKVINYVPSYTVQTAGSSERFASDSWYADIFGKDLLGDALIGRFSVNNVQDLQNIIDKNLSYHLSPAQGAWKNTLLYVADHTDFEAALEHVVNESVPASFLQKRIIMSEEPWEDNYYFPLEIAEAKRAKVSPATTTKIRDAINSGVAMITYFGHGSPNIWSNERIWFGGDSENSDNLMLTNRDKLPLIVNMTCNSGAIDYPMPRWNVCISEDFMRVANGGAVACYVPSGPGITAQHERFTLELNRALLSERVAPLQAGLLLANWRYLAAENPVGLVQMFILLGDPDLRLGLAEPSEANETNSSPAVRETTPLVVKSWKAVPETPVAGQMVELSLSVSNRSHEPLRAARVALCDSTQNPVAFSAPADFLPGQDKQLKISLRAAAGLNHYGVAQYLQAGQSAALEVQPSVMIPGLYTERKAGVAWAAIDTSTLNVRHLHGTQGAQVSVSFKVHNLSDTSLSDMRAGLCDAQGKLLPQTARPVPPLAPGASAQLTLAQDYAALPELQQLQVRLDCYGVLAGSDKWPAPKIEVGKKRLPELVIPQGGIRPSEQTPKDGQTVFFDVRVENRGGSAAGGVHVDGYSEATSSSVRLESRILQIQKTADLAPGSSTTLRVRWDPFHNAGMHKLLFRAVANSEELIAENGRNEQVLPLRVLTKHKLRRAGIGVAKLTDEDRRNGEIRIVARVQNQGESAAHGIKVVFYPTQDRSDPRQALGEVMIDAIPPNSTKEAVLHYKPKPEDKGRVFRFSFEPYLKGSLQRISYSD